MKEFTILLTILFTLYPLDTLESQTLQKWASIYNGTGNLADYSNAIATDDNSNVYVTGRSFGSGSNFDFTTVKYNAAGVQQWVKSYNGTGNGEDAGVSIALDAAGNIHVTGYSTNPAGLLDIVTIKYDPSGAELWTAVFNGSSGHIDKAHYIAVDNSGNVYVTGESVSIGTSYDFITLKYASSGALLWARNYNGTGNKADVGHNLHIDGSGNILVAGHSIGVTNLYDYAVVKYDPSGTELWNARYNGPAGGEDWARAVTCDPAGNVYVTGYSAGSGTNYDFATVKYNSGGVEQWVQRFDGTANGNDRANTITVDNAGNVYVAGGVLNISSNSDFALLKYNTAGALLWAQTYNGPGNSVDMVQSMTIDDSGFVYLTGESAGVGTGFEYATLKYSSGGNMKWAMRFNGIAGGNDLSTALAIDNNYNVYVTGYSFDAGTNYNYTTVKYYQCYMTVNAGNDKTIYIGYGNQSVELTANAAGGEQPYSYLWSNSATTQSIIVSPLVTTNYTVSVMDNQGCMNIDTVTVNVIDVRCGPQNRKVSVCHRGNTICVDAHSVSAHLNHGDVLGDCENSDLISSELISNELYSNYPNPFNPVTQLSFSLQHTGNVKLIIYDITGREVDVVVDGVLESGVHKFDWNGSQYSSGVYFYRLRTDKFQDIKKMVLVK